MDPSDPLTTAHFTATIGLSCYNCNKVDTLSSQGSDLLRCSGCRRLWYCSTKCQKEDWRRRGGHKALCNTLRSLESDAEAMAAVTKLFPQSSETDAYALGRLSVSHKRQMVDLCEKELKRSLKIREFDILSYEPRCLACARTTIVLRVEARLSKSESMGSELIPCPRCGMAFYCCEEHLNIARPLHHAPDPKGGPSQCDMNHRSRVDLEFIAVLTPVETKRLMWRFIRRQSMWSPLKGMDWEAVIGGDVRQAVAGTACAVQLSGCIRRASSLESTAMTILYALEHLNSNTAWTTKSTLTIHMIGSPTDFDPDLAYTYEAILHRIPRLQILHIYFCGPAVATVVPCPPVARCVTKELDACDECYPKGGTIFHHFVTKNYTDFVQSEGTSFEPPDLCLATNTFLRTQDPAQWRKTIKMLVDRGIPSAFTAYDRRIAERNQDVLRDMGAKLIPSLSLVKNPFGDLIMNPNYNQLHGFHSPNGWFSGAFGMR
ncbi:hypothetical protein B0H11DRAFT_2006796 [Mycena galericulata]|nr:hypothetical protein B0H11DRAFT_1870140 [Mycena galericulata]KAJ7492971.1 hypothetical protein B0H11DRAFT_2006796 [Mycena galericulata]